MTADTEKTDVNLETNPQGYFTGSVTVEQHYNGQNENRERYAATMAVLQENGVEVAQSKKESLVTTAWIGLTELPVHYSKLHAVHRALYKSIL